MFRHHPPRRIVSRLALVLGLSLGVGLLAGRTAAGTASAQPAPEAEPAWVTVLGGFARLEDVVARGPEDLWAVGDGIVHWDGATWRQVLNGQRPGLRAIAALPDGTMWAVGTSGAGTCDLAPVVLRYDGTNWTSEPVESHQPLWDVHMVSRDDGWAVGGAERPVILRYDGTRWRPFAEPEVGPLRAIDLIAPDDGWAVGLDGALVHWDGRDWQAVPPPRVGIDLHDIALVDAGFGWAVGAGIDARAGVILALRDGAWRVELLDKSPLLTALSAPARDVALAVGRYGTLLSWDGTSWRDVGRTYPGGFVPTAGDEPAPAGATEAAGNEPAPASATEAAGNEPAPASATDTVGVTEVGGGPKTSADASGARIAGAEAAPAALDQQAEIDPWKRNRRDRTLAERVYLRGLAILTDSETMVAVGDAGQVVVIEGGRYQEVHAGRSLRAIDMLPDGSEGWIVGEDGPPLRWDGRSWQPAPGPIELTWLRDIEAVAPGVAWGVGDAGTVMRFADGRWAKVPFPTTDNLGWLSFGGPNDGWTAVNARVDGVRESRIYRWDGLSWREVLHLCGTTIASGAADARRGAWFAVAGRGMWSGDILRYDGRDWWSMPILGARAPGEPVAGPSRLVVLPDGGGWGAVNGLARLDGGTWRSLVDTARLNDWRDPVRSLYVDAIAASDRSAFWALTRDYRWYEGDVEGGTGGSRIAWFAPAAGYDPAAPDTALGYAHVSTVRLNDLAVTRLADGTTEVWAVGEGGTVLRHRQPGPASVPAASATPAVASTGQWPTPTPHAVMERAAAEAWVRENVMDGQGGESLDFTRVELVDGAQAMALMAKAHASQGQHANYYQSWGTGLDRYSESCRPDWLPWWWIEARGTSGGPCNAVIGALDATNGVNAEFLCLEHVAYAYLPFAQSRRVGPAEPTPSPYPSATARSLTPEAVGNVDGPCPTATPFPTEEYPYP